MTAREMHDIGVRHHRRLAECGTALQIEEVWAEHRRQSFQVEWEIVVGNVYRDTSGYWVQGVVEARGLLGRRIASWSVSALVGGDDQRQRLLAIRPGQVVRVSGFARFGPREGVDDYSEFVLAGALSCEPQSI